MGYRSEWKLGVLFWGSFCLLLIELLVFIFTGDTQFFLMAFFQSLLTVGAYETSKMVPK